MKKTYVQPSVEAITLNAVTLLSNSAPLSGKDASTDENGNYKTLGRRGYYDPELDEELEEEEEF